MVVHVLGNFMGWNLYPFSLDGRQACDLVAFLSLNNYLRLGQDLKDFARTAGEVTFADCHREAEGVG